MQILFQGKVVANKALRYSPRLAGKRNESNKSTNKARRNLFAGDKTYCTPKKKDIQATPKSKRSNYIYALP